MDNALFLYTSFIAGVVSFLSPCILPIIPGFLSYLAGNTVSSAGVPGVSRKSVFLTSVFFVLGFSVIFASFGVLLNTLLTDVAYEVREWLSRIGGVIIIAFGLYLTGLVKIAFFEVEHRFNVKYRFSSRYFTAFVFGAAFAAGWTPCVGAVLGTILGLAVTAPASAFLFLLAYSLGLGLPFLVVGAIAGG